MKFFYILIFLLVGTAVTAQQLPEVVVISYNSKTKSWQFVTSEILKATKTDLEFPIKKKPRLNFPIGYNCCGAPRLKDTVKTFAFRLPVFNVAPDTLKSIQKTGNFRIRCDRGFGGGGDPIYVLDGKVVKNINHIKNEDIVDITVLLGPAASAIHGPRGSHGAIIITTKFKYDNICIIDLLDKTPIPKATLSFVFPEKKDTLRYIANDSGVVSSNSLPKLEGCEMIVTAVGYKPDSKIFKFLNKAGALEIYLTRDIKTCDEVIIVPTVCYRRIGCGWGSKIIRHPEMKRLPDNQPPKALAIFPNPVRKGSIINFSTYDNGKEHLIIKIFTGNGQLTTSQRITINNGFASLPTDPRLASGTYFLQAFYENGRLAASGKIVVH